MEKELKFEAASEILSAALVNNTSDVARLNQIDQFSFSQPQPHDSFMNHAGESMYVTNLKLEILDEELKPEVTSEISLNAIVDSTSDVSCVNEVKNEFLLSETQPYGGFEEHAVVKHEDIQLLNLQIKSEVPNLKCGSKSGIDDTDIEFEPLSSEELYIKSEENFVDQITEKTTQVEHYSCGVCYRKFKSKINLKRHLKNHTKAKPFQCNVCDYSCIGKNDLQRHVKTHTREKPFRCSICEYSCIRKDALQWYIKSHTGEKPFQCNICDYKCIQKGMLQKHMKIHALVKPFQCSTCVYKCTRNYNLQRHLKTHTGERPFKCTVCDFRGIEKSDLKKHTKKHNRRKTSSIQCM